ncbi:uncharacterized protein LOC129583968 [Paramacrobiotus metropolitanus]|uniref:uncharacterized protein LOC129583968 n=1 Tax=Paramacrobiotus metropolitanus TaxID=2943436 RepID=UPI0024465084|nr:uncharacterized protein LOC129583968 [Paramacrobiotus metropolitanus]
MDWGVYDREHDCYDTFYDLLDDGMQNCSFWDTSAQALKGTTLDGTHHNQDTAIWEHDRESGSGLIFIPKATLDPSDLVYREEIDPDEVDDVPLPPKRRSRNAPLVQPPKVTVKFEAAPFTLLGQTLSLTDIGYSEIAEKAADFKDSNSTNKEKCNNTLTAVTSTTPVTSGQPTDFTEALLMSYSLWNPDTNLNSDCVLRAALFCSSSHTQNKRVRDALNLLAPLYPAPISSALPAALRDAPKRAYSGAQKPVSGQGQTTATKRFSSVINSVSAAKKSRALSQPSFPTKKVKTSNARTPDTPTIDVYQAHVQGVKVANRMQKLLEDIDVDMGTPLNDRKVVNKVFSTAMLMDSTDYPPTSPTSEETSDTRSLSLSDEDDKMNSLDCGSNMSCRNSEASSSSNGSTTSSEMNRMIKNMRFDSARMTKILFGNYLALKVPRNKDFPQVHSPEL